MSRQGDDKFQSLARVALFYSVKNLSICYILAMQSIDYVSKNYN